MSGTDMILEPCPFCGFIPDSDDDDCIYPIDCERTTYNLVCYETGGGCGASVLGDSKEDVIDKWQRRSTVKHVGSRPTTLQSDSMKFSMDVIEEARRFL